MQFKSVDDPKVEIPGKFLKAEAKELTSIDVAECCGYF